MKRRKQRASVDPLCINVTDDWNTSHRTPNCSDHEVGGQARTVDSIITRVTLLGVRGKCVPTLLLQWPHGWRGTVKWLERHTSADSASVGVAGGWNTFPGLHATHPKLPLET